MHSSHHLRGDKIVAKGRKLTNDIMEAQLAYFADAFWDAYFQPASLSLRAYIFPMSPIPIIPTMKFSISGGTPVSAIEGIVVRIYVVANDDSKQ